MWYCLTIIDGTDEGIPCGSLCQRLLYNTAVQGVRVSLEPNELAKTSTESRSALFVLLTSNAKCPPLPDSFFDVVWPHESGEMARGRVKQRLAAGECIIRDVAPINTEGITIRFSRIKSGQTMFERPWSLSVDAVGATRLEVTDRNLAFIVSADRGQSCAIVVTTHNRHWCSSIYHCQICRLGSSRDTGRTAGTT